MPPTHFKPQPHTPLHAERVLKTKRRHLYSSVPPPCLHGGISRGYLVLSSAPFCPNLDCYGSLSNHVTCVALYAVSPATQQTRTSVLPTWRSPIMPGSVQAKAEPAQRQQEPRRPMGAIGEAREAESETKEHASQSPDEEKTTEV